MDTISILGCGWLGLPLGRHLVKNGYRVKGATTTPDKLETIEEAGVEPYMIKLDPDPVGDPEDFFESDIIFVNVPPPRGRDDAAAFHQRQMEVVGAAITADWVLFASSTGVYPDADRAVHEDDLPPGGPTTYDGPRRGTGEILETIEGMWWTHEVAATILRFGGLYGPDRHPGRFLAGRTGLSRPSAPVNLIHLDDCIGIVASVLDQNVRDQVFNAVADRHPSRRETYIRAARSLGLEPPEFDMDDTRGGKKIRNDRVHSVLGYTFDHPDPSNL